MWIHIRGTSWQHHLSEVILHTYPGCFWGISKFKPFSDNGSSLRHQRNIKPIDLVCHDCHVFVGRQVCHTVCRDLLYSRHTPLVVPASRASLSSPALAVVPAAPVRPRPAVPQLCGSSNPARSPIAIFVAPAPALSPPPPW